MKKNATHERLFCLFAIGCSLLWTGCTNSDYDFDKIDLTLGFGSDEITLPRNNSTKDILLDDLLDIDDSDLVTTDDNGDYKLFKEPDKPVDPVGVKIDPISVNIDNSEGLTIVIDIPENADDIKNLLPSPTSVIKIPYSYEIAGQKRTFDIAETSGDIAVLQYELKTDDAIKSLEYIDLGKNGQGTNLTLELDVPKDIKKFDKLQIFMPEILDLACKTMPDQYDPQSHTLTLRDYTCSNGHIQIDFNLTRIHIQTKDENNYAKLENGLLKIKSHVEMRVKVGELTIPGTPTITISGKTKIPQMEIEEVRGVFDPAIDLDDIGTININSLPDFLTEEEVVADIDNPQIWLTVSSTMPIGSIIKAQLSSDTHPEPIAIAPFRIAPSADGVNPTLTHIVICRYEPANLAGYTPIIVENLSDLIVKLKEPMGIKFVVTEAKAVQEPGNVKLNHQYQLTPTYRFECPMAFGEKAAIVYSETENDWHEDIDKLQLAKNAYVKLTANVVNKIPADLELAVAPLDVNGQELDASIINIDLIKKDVAGTKNQATESPLEINISGDITRLDGVTLKLIAKSNDQLRGITLNKTTQTLLLKDVTVKLVGKMIYDAN